MDARRNETYVAPKHVDASRDFHFIFPERAAWGEWGGEGVLPDFYFYYFFPVQQTTSGIGHRLAANTLNMRINIPYRIKHIIFHFIPSHPIMSSSY